MGEMMYGMWNTLCVVRVCMDGGLYGGLCGGCMEVMCMYVHM